MSRGTTLGEDERLRIFLALELPDDVVGALVTWGKAQLLRGRPVTSFHVTLAFLGSRPRSELDAVVDVLRRESAAAAPFTLSPVRYRETRSVGMVVLADPSGEATRLAERIQSGLERLGCYRREARRWLPHVTVLRFSSKPGLTPPLPEIAAFAPSGAAALLSRLSPSGARYEVIQSCAVGTPGG